MLVPKRRPLEKSLERRSTARRIEEAELRLVEAEAKRAEDQVQNEGRREELAIEREEIALESDLLERERRRTALAREFTGLVKDVAAAALWVVVAVALIVAALKDSETYTALTILGVLTGGSGFSILRGSLRRLTRLLSALCMRRLSGAWDLVRSIVQLPF